VHGLGLSFGGVRALDSIDLTVYGLGIVGLIGPNGAGKTSLFNSLTGAYRPQTGTAVFGGTELIGLRPHRIAALGLSRTFQNHSLVDEATVLDNVLLGAHLTIRPSLVGALVGSPLARRRDRRERAGALELLDRFGLADVAGAPAGSLPFGSAKRVDLVRALASNPRLVLLDEPASGLTEEETHQLGDWLTETARDLALPMVLVEHHMGLVMRTAGRLVAMNFGRVIADGDPREVSADPAVVTAYFGGVL
jgi:branched-chain amino acid transport system ATP-binding protein